MKKKKMFISSKKYLVVIWSFLSMSAFGVDVLSKVNPRDTVSKFPIENGLLVISYQNIGTPLDGSDVRKNYIQIELIENNNVRIIGRIDAGATEVIFWDGVLYDKISNKSDEYMICIKVYSDGENPIPSEKKVIISKSSLKIIRISDEEIKREKK